MGGSAVCIIQHEGLDREANTGKYSMRQSRELNGLLDPTPSGCIMQTA